MSINDYELIKELGKGSMGLVYLARDHKLERFVAIKKLKVSYEFELSHEDDVVKRFYREARALAGLSHPNFVMVHEVGENKALNEHYIVMEYIEGESLDQMVDSRGALPLNVALKIGIQACEALNHIHAKKFIHRDIKPANLILCNNGVLKIMDFGLVKTEDLDLTKPGTVMGSALFMPAEQIYDIKNIDHRVDIYSLGVTLYYILTGVYPFSCNNLQDLVIKIKNGKYQQLTEVNHNLPKELEYIIQKAISLNREDRYNNMFEFQQCLADFNDKKINTLIFPFRYDLKIKSLTELKNDFQKMDQNGLLPKDHQNTDKMIVKADEQFIGKIIDLTEKNNLKGKETIPSISKYTKTNELRIGDLVTEEPRENNYNWAFINSLNRIVHEAKVIYANLKKESQTNDEELKNLLAKYEKTKDKAYSQSLKMIKQLIEVKQLKNEKYKREKALFLRKIKIYDRILISAQKRLEMLNYLLKNNFFDSFDFITINLEELKRINIYFAEINRENNQLSYFYQECQDNLTNFSEINESLTEDSEPIAILYQFEEEKQTATVRLFGEISKESFIEFDGEDNIIFSKCLVNTNNEETEENRQIRKILIGKTNNLSKSIFPGCKIFKSNKRVFRKEFVDREIKSLMGVMETIQETKEELLQNFNCTCQEVLREIEPYLNKKSIPERLIRNKTSLKETTGLLEKLFSGLSEIKGLTAAGQLLEILKKIT